MAEPLRRVGRYELLEVIGRGGTAVVYLANQPDLNRQVALKELSPHHAGDPRFAERFIAEARLAATLNHPNIVTVHEFFEHDSLPYIAMEYMPRGSLRPYLSTLTLPQIFGMAENVLAGLAHGESHGIIHRDLKPENLLVSGDGVVKISDYGVARALNTVVPRPFATMTGTTIGTPAYMAPEQALGEKLGPAADLYSLGIIIWEALAGRPPFGAADTPMAVLYQKIHEPVQRISELEPDVDPGLAQWLDVILAKAPASRFASASAAWEDLEEVAIKLLGPRWRRDARVAIEGIGSAATPTAAGGAVIAPTQTDAPTPDVPARDAPRAVSTPSETPVIWGSRDTPAGVATPPAAPIDPATAPAYQTVVRNSRRHVGADDDLEGPEDALATTRWGRWVAVALLVAVAAAAGAGVGLGTTPAAPPAATRTVTRPEQNLALRVTPIVRALQHRVVVSTALLADELDTTGQATAAAQLSGAYGAAQSQLAHLPSTLRKLPAELVLSKWFGFLAVTWTQANVAALANNAAKFDIARKKIAVATTFMAAAIAKAEDGLPYTKVVTLTSTTELDGNT